MPLQATSGAASYDGFGGGVAAVPNYIEDVFSTYLYDGNGSTQTITNGIDLSTKGGLVWLKSRSTADNHFLFDTTRGATKLLQSNTTGAEITNANTLTSFASTGFSLGTETAVNRSGTNYASWTFREQPKFFDVVTYTGTGSARTVAHNLGSVPACIIIKRTTGTATSWAVYHRSLGNTNFIKLNQTTAVSTSATYWNNTDPTSTEFTVATNNEVNTNGETYIAYLFAHNAGGFGLTGTDNVISCGSYTGNGSATGPVVTLGYEPQWVMIKRAVGGIGDWSMHDNMRGLSYSGYSILQANTSAAEATGTTPNFVVPLATGFQISGTTATNYNTSGNTYIYIAIRRGPMKVPTSGTSVFSPIARSGTSAVATVTNNITSDVIISQSRNTEGIGYGWWDRLRGFSNFLGTGTGAELTSSDSLTAMNNSSYVLGADTVQNNINFSTYTYANWTFRRAPSFMDVVCYTGTGANRTLTHNLQAVPELIICKRRNSTVLWGIYSNAIANTDYLALNSSDGKVTDATVWNSTTPTSSVFSVGTSNITNNSVGTYVAYLFATCAGVSKVGSYTGTATTKQIDCGFTAGARFVLIKRTDASTTGSWYVWDSARGIVAGNDPYLLLNSAAAEITNTDYIDTYSAGFELSSTAPAAINASGGTFIFLAIA